MVPRPCHPVPSSGRYCCFRNGSASIRCPAPDSSNSFGAGGTLLVDEIDTGLYYRIQSDVWRLILTMATELDVQVFATTHSLDNVRAFQEALEAAHGKGDGKLFRLSVRDGDIVPIPYTPEELHVVVEQQIEVR
ncbi:MAG: ATP-binding protein [Armatimonadetes bacterium]|nr:ATP-binding protein [Armatimonadota bacterium]